MGEAGHPGYDVVVLARATRGRGSAHVTLSVQREGEAGTWNPPIWKPEGEIGRRVQLWNSSLR